MACLETQMAFSAATRLSRKTWWVIAVLGSAVSIGAAFYFDAIAVEWIARHKTPALVAFMRNVSRWGDWYSHVAVGAVLAAIAYARGNRRWFRVFLVMLLACAIAGVVTRVVKVSTGRARPSVRADAGWHGPRLASKYNAFPSGHTASSTAFFAALAFASPRIGLALLPIPLLIALSRMYVGAHHPSDVVCAGVLGVLTAWLVWRSKFLSVPDSQSAAGT